jgi:hypothetical protein
MDMAIQRDDKDEREARMDILIKRFQEAEKRDLLERGIALWTQTEAQSGIPFLHAPLPPNKIN